MLYKISWMVDADFVAMQRRYKDRDSRQHRVRSRERREEDTYRSSRRDRSRDRRRSRDREVIKGYRRDSRDRDSRAKRDNSRDRTRRRREDSIDSRRKERRADRREDSSEISYKKSIGTISHDVSPEDSPHAIDLLNTSSSIVTQEAPSSNTDR